MRTIVNMSEEDRATDPGKCTIIGKDLACGSGDILADRSTHRQTYLSQYFATKNNDFNGKKPQGKKGLGDHLHLP